MLDVMEVTAEDRAGLERLARSQAEPHRKVIQARALLMLADVVSIRATAAEPAINVAAPIMIVTGVLMVAIDDAWGFTSPFVLIGIGAILMSAIVGIPILREMRALQALIDDQGESDEVIGRYGRVSTAWTGLGLVYLVAVWAMIFKP